jgi:hypothetical protein
MATGTHMPKGTAPRNGLFGNGGKEMSEQDETDQEFYELLADAAELDEATDNVPQNAYIREMFRRL